jgi:hypothetical protein
MLALWLLLTSGSALAAISYRSKATATESSGTGSSGIINYVGSGYFDNWCYNSGGSPASGYPSGVWPYLPTNKRAGDLLLCLVESRDNVQPTANTSYATGWTRLYSLSNGSGSQASLFYKFATSTSEPDPFFNHSGGGIVSQCAAFRGVDTSNPFDAAYASANSAADSTVESGSLTTVTANAMMVFPQHFADNHSSTAVTQQANLNWTNGYFVTASAGSQGGESLGLAYATKTTAGAVGPAAAEAQYSGSSTAAVSTGALLALRPAAATSGLTINVPAGTTTGDVLIAALAVRPDSITLGTPSGWTLVRSIQQTSRSTNKLAIYRRSVTGSEPASYTWTYGGSHTGLVGSIASFSGVDTTTPIQSENGSATSSSLSHTAPAITTTAANAMLVGSFAFSSSTNWTPPSGMTEAVDIASRSVKNSSGESMEVTYQTQSAAGSTGTRTASASTSDSDYRDRGVTHLLALNPYIPPTLDHVRLEHDGGAVTCAREPVTIRACTDANCTSVYTGSVSLTLSPGGWWNAATGGTQSDTVTISGGSGVFYLANATSSSVTLEANSISSASGGSPTYKCFVGSTQSCALSFATSGFNFSTIPTQSAGVTSSNLSLQAVTGTSGGACTGFSSAKTVGLAMQCIDPTTCAGAQISVNGTAIASNPASGISSWTSVSLSFDSASTATFTLNYPDVGRLRLSARYPAGSSTGTTGSSGTFVVRPYDLTWSNIERTADSHANPAANTAAGDIFIKAGAPFSATLTAVNYSGVATPNFGKEMAPEGFNVTHSLVAPSGGAAGTLGGTRNLTGSSFSAGSAHLTDLTWDDVGTITLTAALADGDYLGSGALTKTSGYIGRFTPHHFNTEMEPACPSGTEVPPEHFTYSGQPFTEVTVAAVDADNDTVQNYDATLGYAKTITLSDAGDNGVIGSFTDNTLTSEVSEGVGVKTTLSYEFVNKATAPRQFALRATDTDSISSAAGTEAHPWIYSGRLYVGNATGSELTPLAVPLLTQYYNGTAWVTNTEDVCTSLTANFVSFSSFSGNLATGETAASISNDPLTGGDAGLSLSAPGAGNAGSANVTVTTPGAYLQFDWNGDSALDDPSATVIFGSSTPAGVTVIDTRENF